MAYINWSEPFSVNIKEIDEEHKILIAMLNELHEAIIDFHSDGRNGAAKKTVAGMLDYASHHFATEEKYMLEYNFPRYAEHKKEHADFLNQALALNTKIAAGGYVFNLDIASFLRSWLSHHIMGTDKKYTSFFNEHGLY
jgi:hemerythrin